MPPKAVPWSGVLAIIRKCTMVTEIGESLGRSKHLVFVMQSTRGIETAQRSLEIYREVS